MTSQIQTEDRCSALLNLLYLFCLVVLYWFQNNVCFNFQVITYNNEVLLQRSLVTIHANLMDNIQRRLGGTARKMRKWADIIQNSVRINAGQVKKICLDYECYESLSEASYFICLSISITLICQITSIIHWNWERAKRRWLQFLFFL